MRDIIRNDSVKRLFLHTHSSQSVRSKLTLYDQIANNDGAILLIPNPSYDYHLTFERKYKIRFIIHNFIFLRTQFIASKGNIYYSRCHRSMRVVMMIFVGNYRWIRQLNKVLFEDDVIVSHLQIYRIMSDEDQDK